MPDIKGRAMTLLVLLHFTVIFIILYIPGGRSGVGGGGGDKVIFLSNVLTQLSVFFCFLLASALG